MGTYRMGDDPKTSVVDLNQRSHDHDNLYLVGSGTFPTGATANPTLTLRRWRCAARTALSATSNHAARRGVMGVSSMKPPNPQFTDRRHPVVASAFDCCEFSPLAATIDCPTPVSKPHTRAAAAPPLNIDTVKALLLDYHQQYYDIDVAAVFDSCRLLSRKKPLKTKRPALVLDIDETSLTNWPNPLADNFGFVADGPCVLAPGGSLRVQSMGPQLERQGD